MVERADKFENRHTGGDFKSLVFWFNFAKHIQNKSIGLQFFYSEANWQRQQEQPGRKLQLELPDRHARVTHEYAC